MNSLIPVAMIILIDSGNLPSIRDLDEEADMALELLSAAFHDKSAIWPNNVVGTAADPDLLNCSAFGCWEETLFRYQLESSSHSHGRLP